LPRGVFLIREVSGSLLEKEGSSRSVSIQVKRRSREEGERKDEENQNDENEDDEEYQEEEENPGR
jgi:hypothetical protein